MTPNTQSLPISKLQDTIFELISPLIEYNPTTGQMLWTEAVALACDMSPRRRVLSSDVSLSPEPKTHVRPKRPCLPVAMLAREAKLAMPHATQEEITSHVWDVLAKLIHDATGQSGDVKPLDRRLGTIRTTLKRIAYFKQTGQVPARIKTLNGISTDLRWINLSAVVGLDNDERLTASLNEAVPTRIQLKLYSTVTTRNPVTGVLGTADKIVSRSIHLADLDPHATPGTTAGQQILRNVQARIDQLAEVLTKDSEGVYDDDPQYMYSDTEENYDLHDVIAKAWPK